MGDDDPALPDHLSVVSYSAACGCGWSYATPPDLDLEDLRLLMQAACSEHREQCR